MAPLKYDLEIVSTRYDDCGSAMGTRLGSAFSNADGLSPSICEPALMSRDARDIVETTAVNAIHLSCCGVVRAMILFSSLVVWSVFDMIVLG